MRGHERADPEPDCRTLMYPATDNATHSITPFRSCIVTTKSMRARTAYGARAPGAAEQDFVTQGR